MRRKKKKFDSNILKKYVLYYTKQPNKPLSDWTPLVLDGDQLETTIADQDEETPFVVRMQAINPDGPGIISETYEVTTGIKRMEDFENTFVNNFRS
jgi:hypothetical protein